MSAACSAIRCLPSHKVQRTSQMQQGPGGSGSLVVRAASGPPPMRSFEPPPASSNGSAPPLGQASFPSSGAMPASSSSISGGAVPVPAAPRSYRVSVWDAMKFNGPVPERVNGRLAMLAMIPIAQQEMATGQTGGWASCALRLRCWRWRHALHCAAQLPFWGAPT
jgi:hypothetical protein